MTGLTRFFVLMRMIILMAQLKNVTK